MPCFVSFQDTTFELAGVPVKDLKKKALGVSLSSKSIIIMPCFLSFQDTTLELAGVPVKYLKNK